MQLRLCRRHLSSGLRRWRLHVRLQRGLHPGLRRGQHLRPHVRLRVHDLVRGGGVLHCRVRQHDVHLRHHGLLLTPLRSRRAASSEELAADRTGPSFSSAAVPVRGRNARLRSRFSTSSDTRKRSRDHEADDRRGGERGGRTFVGECVWDRSRFRRGRQSAQKRPANPRPPPACRRKGNNDSVGAERTLVVLAEGARSA